MLTLLGSHQPETTLKFYKLLHLLSSSKQLLTSSLKEEGEIIKTINTLVGQLHQLKHLHKRINNQKLSLCIYEVTPGFWEIQILGAVDPAIKSNKIYISNQMLNILDLRAKILVKFKTNKENLLEVEEHRLLSFLTRELLLNMKEVSNRSKPHSLVCSNNLKYKNIGSFAKAFGVTKATVFKYVDTGIPLRGVTLTSKDSSNKTKTTKEFTSHVVLRKQKHINVNSNKESFNAIPKEKTVEKNNSQSDDPAEN